MKKASLPSMVKELQRRFPDAPSWPFRTESARTVWSATEDAFDADPNLTVDQAIKTGFIETGIPSHELTPEDVDLLGMAARWKAYTLRDKRKTDQPKALASLLLRTQNMASARDSLASMKTQESIECRPPRNRSRFSSSRKTHP